MKELITTKITPAALKNFKLASAMSGDKQYDVIEQASKDILKKISDKIKSSKPKK